MTDGRCGQRLLSNSYRSSSIELSYRVKALDRVWHARQRSTNNRYLWIELAKHQYETTSSSITAPLACSQHSPISTSTHCYVDEYHYEELPGHAIIPFVAATTKAEHLDRENCKSACKRSSRITIRILRRVLVNQTEGSRVWNIHPFQEVSTP